MDRMTVTLNIRANNIGAKRVNLRSSMVVANLIATVRRGREKLHYLNPGPMQEVAGWVDRYRRFWDERFDRLEDYLRELQQKEQENDRS